MRVSDCHNIEDFRRLARGRLPAPVFHYIDGAADDEVTKARNTAAFDDCDLVPDVLAGIDGVDPSVEVLGRRIAMPLFLSPTGLQRLFHWQGELAVARAARDYDTFFGLSSLGSVTIEDFAANYPGPKLFQLYVHRDRGLNRELLERARTAGFDALALTVDTIVGGNRERDLRTGFTSPPRLTPGSAWSFASRPGWLWDYLTHAPFRLANLAGHVPQGSAVSTSVASYINQMLDPTLDWRVAEELRAQWPGAFCLKGVMSVRDARRAAAMGASAIMVSNHGGRQLDGSRAPFDQLAEIVDSVGDRIEVILDGGVRRGSHVLKALAMGARAVSGGRLYLYALAAAGEPGVRRALFRLKAEIERDMALMGVRTVGELSREKLRFRGPPAAGPGAPHEAGFAGTPPEARTPELGLVRGV
jgi:L-lactate dehydrogenase (cytochrome)